MLEAPVILHYTLLMKLFSEITGSGMPLLLLHGNGEDHTIFNESARILSEHFTVYAIDSRGHGKSPAESVFHYSDMAEDIIELIHDHALVKPYIYGFSDGGIIALLAAMAEPDLPKAIAVSGANLSPSGLGFGSRLAMKLQYLFTRNPLLKLMLCEPHITPEMLSRIQVPTLVLAGEHDLIREKETRTIAASIKNSELMIIPNEDHSSYIVHSTKIANILIGNWCRGKGEQDD